MNSHYTYLLVDLASVLVPFLFSFDKRVSFYQHWPRLFIGILLTGIFFVVWDHIFTDWGIWHFNQNYVLPGGLGNLPWEEVLFFITIPYCCAFVYVCLPFYFRKLNDEKAGWNLFLGTAFALLIAAAIFHQKTYTLFATATCGVGMLLVYLFRRRLPGFRALAFLVSYLVCLLPFFIVNGILTALPVVIYDDTENIGVRLFTIPAEDVFYGMALVLGAVVWLREPGRFYR